jgi:peptide/nickel transport system substrate-binding protein
MISWARFRPLGLALAALALITGCYRQPADLVPAHPAQPATPASNPAANPGLPVQGDWVVQRISSDIDTLNPVTVGSTDGAMISSLISEGLLQMDPFTQKLIPCLAESWEISPDQFTYTFHLRHGVKWHDGTPLTADDIKYSYDRLMDPKVDAADKRSYFENIKSCEIVDPHTIRFTASERYFKTLESLGTTLAIVPRHAFDTGDSDFNKNEFGRKPIGTGPYKFVRWNSGSEIVLERNDDYWDTVHPLYPHYPKRLVFQIVQEPFIAAQLLKKGEIDVFDNVSPVIWKFELEHSSVLQHDRKLVYPYPAYTYLGFNLRDPLFADIRVRHAIDLLIPRDDILKKIYFDEYANLTSGPDPASSRNYNQSVPPTAFNPTQAQQLLADAGWKNDHGDGILYKDGKPLTFTLLYRAGNPNEQKIVELIQESLTKAGIDLKLDRLEFAQWIERVDEWKFEATIGGWGLDINGDPSQLWSSSEADIKKSSNFIGYKNAEADKLIAAGRLEYDDEKRAVIYRQLHQIIHDDYPCCFLLNPKFIALVSNRYQNVKTFAGRPCFDITEWWVPLDQQKYKN